jgi:hypothetical protein
VALSRIIRHQTDLTPLIDVQKRIANIAARDVILKNHT